MLLPHAWTFNNQGELIRVPDEAGYSKAFNRAEMGLKSPPRVDNYRGFIFVSFNPAVEDLVTYLAGASYIDLIVDQAEEGMRMISGSNRYFIKPTGSYWSRTAWTDIMSSLLTKRILNT